MTFMDGSPDLTRPIQSALRIATLRHPILIVDIETGIFKRTTYVLTLDLEGNQVQDERWHWWDCIRRRCDEILDRRARLAALRAKRARRRLHIAAHQTGMEKHIWWND